ncbi:fumarylacetoacetate hydrolase family protein [Sphingobium ummariense]|nr:fumarylacetoacetate hydrolase family protein [Sphingobium ummariense]
MEFILGTIGSTYLSTIIPLQPGDVVATATTGGVGLFREPPI